MNKPTIHTFGSTGRAYNASQCSDDIHDGDVLSVPSEGVVGIMLSAWPTAISENAGEFHTPAFDDWSAVPTGVAPASGRIEDYETEDYSASYELARKELDRITNS